MRYFRHSTQRMENIKIIEQLSSGTTLIRCESDGAQFAVTTKNIIFKER